MRRFSSRSLLACISLGPACGLVLGCADDGSDEGVRRTIGRDGGQISSRDGVLTVAIPPGALSETITVEIYPSDLPPQVLFGAYRVQPGIALDRSSIVTFHRALPQNPDGVRVAAIAYEDFESGAGGWKPLPLLELDPDHDMISGTDLQLSLFYAVMEVDGTGTGTDTGSDASSDSGTSTTGTESDGTTGGSSESGESTGFGPLSHALDIQPIWDDHCVGGGCHEPVAEGGNPTAAVRLHDDAYPNLVDVLPSLATVPYVTPGSPQESYLMHKLDGTHLLPADEGGCGCSGSGVSMPLGQRALQPGTRNLIRAWISQGAPP